MRAAARRMQDSEDHAQAAGHTLPDDAWLMSRIAKGDVHAYETLVNRHLDRFLAFAQRVTGDRAVAEDILQEAYLRIWTKAKDWRPEGARFTTWFYRIVLNLSIDHKRRKKPEALPDGFDAADGSGGAERQMVAAEGEAVVSRALDSLPPRQNRRSCYVTLKN